MKGFSFSRGFKLWRRQRRRWPLTRQIAALFGALMIANGLLVSTALDYWGEYRIGVALKTMSPSVQRSYERFDKDGYIPTGQELKDFTREFSPVQDRLNSEINTALYVMIAIAGVLTMAFGYLILGRLGRGLGSVALAARRIADGDLTARAALVGFASREETQLIGDFNIMSVALQGAERELAESTASIAHELRTPLTILRGRLHGIADGVFALEPKEVEGLLYQVEGLGRLVDDLQTLSLANAQRLILAREKTNLAEEVRRVLASIGPDLEAAGLDVILALESVSLSADGARIRQVISAVLNNACRYAAHSGALRIGTYGEGSDAVLEIIDHGAGLPEDSDSRAFDRFWRGEASRSRNTGGSGLGLSVVRAIVEAHGGSATLANHVGGGAHFAMRLPAKEAQTKSASHSLHAKPTPAT
jgi:two-component system, OmpR family, sensor histidine kinase AdeS